MSKKSDDVAAAEAAEDRRDARAEEKRERAAEDREAVKAAEAKADKAVPFDDPSEDAPPLVEYPKMLYVGATRQQVTVNTAEEEAAWLADSEKPKGKR